LVEAIPEVTAGREAQVRPTARGPSIRLRYAKDYRQSVGGAAERRSGGDLAP
jgi:hypothetical protein